MWIFQPDRSEINLATPWWLYLEGPSWMVAPWPAICYYISHAYLMKNLVCTDQCTHIVMTGVQVTQVWNPLIRGTIKVHTHLHWMIARFLGPSWGPSGAERTQVGLMLAPWNLLSGTCIGGLVQGCDIASALVTAILQYYEKPSIENWVLWIWKSSWCRLYCHWWHLRLLYQRTRALIQYKDVILSVQKISFWR